MNTEEGRPRWEEEKAKYDFKTASKTEENSLIDAVRTGPGHHSDNLRASSSSEDTQTFSKPSLSYSALIAKVILSSPSQKLNLGSIYKAMEEQFPYLRSRGPGWRNSVRHNLSVNDCFVKVSRCEDGRGHYWGVHQAYLRDFQDGNFSQYRNTRGRRERERCESLTGCMTWMETSCFLGRFCKTRSGSMAWLKPQCPLQESNVNQMSSLERYQPLSISVDRVQSPSWMKHYCCPKRLPDTSGKAALRRGHDSQSLTSGLRCWKTIDPVPKGLTESYDSRFTMPPVQPLSFHCYWCLPQVRKELIHPLPYKINF